MYDDDEAIDPDEVRHTLRRVAAYREVCERVRKGSTGALFFGGVMLAIWWFALPEKNKYDWYGIIYLTLGCLEFGSGLLNRLFPSAEGVLLSAIVLTCFGIWSVARYVLIWQNMMPGPANPILSIFGVLWTIQGFRQALGYLQLRREFADRPNRAQIRWFNDLLREIKFSDPKVDPQAVYFDTQPPLTGKLLGDTAFLIDKAQTTIIVSRREVQLEREESGNNRPARGYLTVAGVPFRPFPLGEKTWDNYSAWKREGGEVVPPVVRPAIRNRDQDNDD